MLKSKPLEAQKKALKWYRLNTKVRYSDEFWAEYHLCSALNSLPEWEKVYKARAALLKMYRGIDSMEINAARLNDKAKEAKERIERYDKWLALNKRKGKGSGPKFSDIAKIKPTEEFRIAEESQERP